MGASGQPFSSSEVSIYLFGQIMFTGLKHDLASCKPNRHHIDVLIFLALNRGVKVTTEKIKQEIYRPKLLQDHERQYCSEAISTLRRVFPDGCDRFPYRAKDLTEALRESYIDVIDFDDTREGLRSIEPSGNQVRYDLLKHAYNLYKGIIAPGITGEWIDKIRERKHQEWEIITRELAAVSLDHGHFDERIGYLRRLVTEFPATTEYYVHLMQQYANLEDYQGVTDTYELFVESNGEKDELARCFDAATEQIKSQISLGKRPEVANSSALQDGLDIGEAAHGSDYAASLYNEAESLADQGRHAKSLQLAEEAAEIARRVSNDSLECQALTLSLKCLIRMTDWSDIKREDLIERANAHLKRAEQTGLSPLRAAYYRFLIASDVDGQLAEHISELMAIPGAHNDLDILFLQLQIILTRYPAEAVNEAVVALYEDLQSLIGPLTPKAQFKLLATQLLCKAELKSITKGDIKQFESAVATCYSEHIFYDIGILIISVVDRLQREGYQSWSLGIADCMLGSVDSFSDVEVSFSEALRLADTIAVFVYTESLKFYSRAEEYARRYTSSNRQGEIRRAQMIAAVMFNRMGNRFSKLMREPQAHRSLNEWDNSLSNLSDIRNFVNDNFDLGSAEMLDMLAACDYLQGKLSVHLGRYSDGYECLSRYIRYADDHADRHDSPQHMLGRFLAAQCLVGLGRLEEAFRLLEPIPEMICPENLLVEITEYLTMLKNHLLPAVTWSESDEAKKLAEHAKRFDVRHVIREQVITFFALVDESPPDSEQCNEVLYDYWGRGRFARIAAGIRARPLDCICVDAYSIDQLRVVASVLCPLFDTVLVRWKGELGSGLAFAPIHEDRVIEMGCGTGYALCAGSVISDHWSPIMGFGVFLPPSVMKLMTREGRSLIASGRLLIVAAPLIGCCQVATGWSDDLLVNGFLGGTINASGRADTKIERSGAGRTLDLASITLPYIAGVPLSELASILEDVGPLLQPFRQFVFGHLANDDLRLEKWEAIRAMESEFRETSRYFTEQLRKVKANDATIATSSGTLKVTATEPTNGHHSLTKLLQSLVPNQDRVSPWAPFCALESAGGYFDWSAPFINTALIPSKDPISTEIAWLLPPLPKYGAVIPTMVGMSELVSQQEDQVAG